MANPMGALAGSVALGAAVGLAARELARILTEPRRDEARGLLERQRRGALRQHSRGYRGLEPLIDRLEPAAARLWANRLPDLQRDLELIEKAPWKASEYLVAAGLAALPAVLAAAALAGWLTGPLPAVFVLLLGGAVVPLFSRRRVADRARRYRLEVRNRLPFVVDLMALMLEAGAIFRECLETAAAENRDHAVGEEFGRVCRAVAQGVPQAEALRGLGRRMEDADVFELVFAVNTAEERGTRLKDVLADMAEQMRHRRVQWLERAAEEAKVHITWPGMLVMLACLLIVAAPLLLSGLASFGR